MTMRVPLDTYLQQQHARNNTGKRNVGDLTLDELRTLDEKDIRLVASVLHSVVRMSELEAARYRRDYYLAKSCEFAALRTNAERDYKLADMRNRGVACDGEP